MKVRYTKRKIFWEENETIPVKIGPQGAALQAFSGGYPRALFSKNFKVAKNGKNRSRRPSAGSFKARKLIFFILKGGPPSFEHPKFWNPHYFLNIF